MYRFLIEAGYLHESFGEAMMGMVGFRNRIVHLYWDVDVDRLYQYLQQDVPLLGRFRDFALQVLTAEEDAQLENG